MGDLSKLSDSAKIAFLMEALLDAAVALTMRGEVESSERYAGYVYEMRGETTKESSL